MSIQIATNTDLAGTGATLSTSVYANLRADIVSGALRPGDRLRLAALGERYKVGNTPIREALNRLVADQLVTREEQKGFRVAGVGREQLLELSKTRCWLEERALRESIAQGDDPWEERLVLAFHHLVKTSRADEMDPLVTSAAWTTRHDAFHHALIAACGSSWLLAFCEQLRDQATRYRNIAQALVYPQRTTSDEHRAIFEAAVHRRVDDAVELLLEHYRFTTRIVVDSNPGTLA